MFDIAYLPEASVEAARIEKSKYIYYLCQNAQG